MENVRRAKNAPDFLKLHKQWDSKLQKVLIVRSVVFFGLVATDQAKALNSL